MVPPPLFFMPFTANDRDRIILYLGLNPVQDTPRLKRSLTLIEQYDAREGSDYVTKIQAYLNFLDAIQKRKEELLSQALDPNQPDVISGQLLNFDVKAVDLFQDVKVEFNSSPGADALGKLDKLAAYYRSLLEQLLGAWYVIPGRQARLYRS